MSDEPRYSGIDAETFIRWGKEAAEAGNRRRAYSYFSQALRLKPEDEEAWLWKGAMAEDPQESLACMRKALSINPKSRRAWQGLEWAAARLAQERGQAPEMIESSLASVPPEIEPVPAVPSAVTTLEEESTAEEEPPAFEVERRSWPESIRESIEERWLFIVMVALSAVVVLAFFLLLRILGS